MTYGQAPSDIFVRLHALDVQSKFCLPTPNLAAHRVIPVSAVRWPFWSRPKQKNGLGVLPCRTCVPIFVQIQPCLHTQIAETQFGSHFAADILVTGKTTKTVWAITMPDVRANFRPNPATLTCSNRGDAPTPTRTHMTKLCNEAD